MGRRPCGCDLIRDARQTGGREGDTLEHFAKEYQLEWRCPFSGEFKEPKPGDEHKLTDECQRATKDVAGLIGSPDTVFATCPSWYARQPYVHHAVNARWHAEHGGLAEFEPNASQALFDAIHLINAGLAERTNREIDIAKREAEDRVDQARRGPKSGD